VVLGAPKKIDPILSKHSVGITLRQCCQMVYFQTKYPNMGKFQRALYWKMLIYFMVIGNILGTFCTFCVHLVHFFRFWYHVPRKIWQPCTAGIAKSKFW
jgi:hypothetical protein